MVEIRAYAGGDYRYDIDADGDDGGLMSEPQLIATGERASPDALWHGPLRCREVVRIADDCPDVELRGLYGVVEDCLAGEDDSYGVMVSTAPLEESYEAIDVRYLLPAGERLPPQPVPRSVTTYRAVGHVIRPTHEFTIVDELDQYL